ncbi:MAG: hypothetical protein WBA25_06140 [Jannaschia sp.]
MSDNGTNPKPLPVASRAASIGIALAMLMAGLVALMMPLGAALVPGNDLRDIAYSIFPLSYWVGLFLMMAGISVLLARIVKIDAEGAGTLKFLGIELPIAVGGAAFLLIALMLGGAAVTRTFELHLVMERFEERQVAERERLEAKEREERELSEEAEENARMAGLYESEKLLASAYGTILTGQMDRDGVHLMRLRVQCSRRRSHWIDWPPVRENEQFVEAILRADAADEVDVADVSPFVLRPNGTDFILLTADREQIMSTRLTMEGGHLVATLTPLDVSLQDLCDSLDPAIRDAQAVGAGRSLDDPGDVTNAANAAANQ